MPTNTLDEYRTYRDLPTNDARFEWLFSRLMANESRIAQLEVLCQAHGITYPPPPTPSGNGPYTVTRTVV